VGKKPVLLGGSNNLAYYGWRFSCFSKLILLESSLLIHHFLICKTNGVASKEVVQYVAVLQLVEA
jgi:hypothetical protein